MHQQTGDNAYHGSATVHHADNKHIRIIASISIADINEQNAANMTYTQPYPPKNAQDRLRQAGEHWRATDASVTIQSFLKNFEAGKHHNFSSPQAKNEEL